MPVKKILMHGFIAIYLILTFLAFCFTMSRWKPLGYAVIFPFYGMMAPYQGYSTEHIEMIAEGQRSKDLWPAGRSSPAGDEGWELIDIFHYYPGRRGEGVIRQQMRLIKWFYGEEALASAQTTLAKQIRAREADAGRPYTHVKLSWEIWPLSIESYEAQRHEPFIRRVPIIEVP